MKKSLLILGLLICSLTNYAQETGTFKDPRDGKVYKTVKIGTQTWFAENLAFKTDSGCWAYDNKDSNVVKYGYLYNWETAKTVCPSGWHTPNIDEWKILGAYLSNEDVIIFHTISYPGAGGKMKNIADWNTPNEGATNESGFNALPAGGRTEYSGKFESVGQSAQFWSSTQGETNGYCWAVYLYNLFKSLDTNSDQSNDNGCSVRCVKD